MYGECMSVCMRELGVGEQTTDSSLSILVSD